jgi:hypothetical protein
MGLDGDIEDMLMTVMDRVPAWKTDTMAFVKSLRDQYEEKGELTEKQLEKLEQIYNELEDKR